MVPAPTQLSETSSDQTCTPYFALVSVSINLFSFSSVSFRAIPKIFHILKEGLLYTGEWIPHFTTLIYWILRIGLFLISTVSPNSEPMCWIVDHTIQVGCKKAMVVLRAPLTVMAQERPLQLNDVEVVSITMKNKWNGDEVFQTLTQLSEKIGIPRQIISDQGSDLKKGLKKFIAKKPIHLTPDISHYFSNLFKRKYKSVPIFQDLMKNFAKARNLLQQTKLAHLVPPKQRTKARFLNLGALSKWTKLIVRWRDLNRDGEGPRLWDKFFSWFENHLFFLHHFSREVAALNEIQEIIKKKGLNDQTYNASLKVLDQEGIWGSLRDSIQEYLQSELRFAQESQISSCISSDIIESLFGKFKYQAKTHAFSELNRMILILPTLCKGVTPHLAQRAFKTITTKDVDQWVGENASDTLLSRRRKVFATDLVSHRVEKLGKKLREAA